MTTVALQNPMSVNSTNFVSYVYIIFYHERPWSEVVGQPLPVGILQVLADTMFHLVLLNRTSQGA